ncbi:TetR family transcriptional regulator [Streptomyces sp. NPDC005931]|uniref:TetR family transcriptional regulator n=1 Tax=Streptomyces sp. NPDC005931 TaxID=3364737 RepID=UPI0036A521EB
MAKQARALRTHDRVLDAAAYEFARFGYADTNLQRVADRIGLTKGALYGHFSSKEELAAALTDHLSRGVHALLDAARASSGPAAGRLEALVLELGALFGTDRRAQAALRLEVEAARAAGGVAPVLTGIQEVARHLVSEVQRAGLWDDTLPADPLADLIVAALFTAFWAGVDPDRNRPGPSVPAMWDILARTLGTGATA